MLECPVHSLIYSLLPSTCTYPSIALFPFILSLTGPSHTSIYPSTHSSITRICMPPHPHPPSIHHTATHALTCLPTPLSIQQMFSVGVNFPHLKLFMQPLAATSIPPSHHPCGPYERKAAPRDSGMTGTRLYQMLAPGSSSEAIAQLELCGPQPFPGLRLLASLTLDLCPCLWSSSPFPSCHHLGHLTGHMDGAPTSGFFISLTSHPMAFPLYPPVLWSHCGPQHHPELLNLSNLTLNTHLFAHIPPSISSHPSCTAPTLSAQSSGLGFLICQLPPRLSSFPSPWGPSDDSLMTLWPETFGTFAAPISLLRG